ncbi:Crp/Fnr family transcriptional regulator [Nocardioides pacificus]
MATERRTTPLRHGCEVPHSCPRSLRLDVLGHAPYFAGLDPDEIAAIDRRMQVRGHAEGETIHRAGDPATHLFILATGRAKVLRPALGPSLGSSSEGGDVLVDVLTPGALIGSVSALGRSSYPDTAQALTVACTLSIGAADFRRVLADHPAVALAVLDDVADRLEQAQQSVRRLSGGTVEQRVAAALLTLADKLGEPHGDSLLLQLPLTRADLAAMTGTTTESVSRTLSRMRRDGLVDTGRRWTAITDRAALTRLARGTAPDA